MPSAELHGGWLRRRPILRRCLRLRCKPSGRGSPWVATTDGTNNAIVWFVNALGNHRLHGYAGDAVYVDGGANLRLYRQLNLHRVQIRQLLRGQRFRLTLHLHLHPLRRRWAVSHRIQLQRLTVTPRVIQNSRPTRRPRPSFQPRT